jgi:hypothetical protein
VNLSPDDLRTLLVGYTAPLSLTFATHTDAHTAALDAAAELVARLRAVLPAEQLAALDGEAGACLAALERSRTTHDQAAAALRALTTDPTPQTHETPKRTADQSSRNGVRGRNET